MLRKIITLTLCLSTIAPMLCASASKKDDESAVDMKSLINRTRAMIKLNLQRKDKETEDASKQKLKKVAADYVQRIERVRENFINEYITIPQPINAGSENSRPQHGELASVETAQKVWDAILKEEENPSCSIQ